MAFTAKYRSACRDCTDGIQPGETIELDDDREPYHVVCPDDTFSLGENRGKPRPVCPHCFLTLPVTGVCECRE